MVLLGQLSVSESLRRQIILYKFCLPRFEYMMQVSSSYFHINALISDTIADFGLSQIFPIVDEDEDQIAKVVKCSFVGSYVAALKDDGKVALLRADKAGELDEV